MKKYLNLLKIFALNSIQLEVEYRVNFLFNALNSTMTFGASLIILFVVFSNVETIGGWSFTETLTLYGVFLILEAFIDAFLFPNLNKIPEYIRTGNMDFILLKPISSQFLISFRYARIWRVPEGILGLGVVFYGMQTTMGLNILNIFAVLILLLCSTIIVYAIWLTLTASAFWLVKVENISELFSAFFSAGRFPVTAFPPWARFFLTFIVPIAFITTVPASAAIGKLNLGMALASVIISVLFLLLSHLFWLYATASYVSASS